MPPILNQRVAIDNLNWYLQWHNLPVRVNQTGICNGLACVHAKYALEGKESEFFEILNHIATMTTTPDFEDKINHFVVEVVLSFIPALFDPDKSQAESIEFLQINGKKLASSFNLGLIANDKNWQAIFNEINLRENEVAIIRTTNHAFTVRKFQEKYRIYDPNYYSGSKIFANEEELVHELCRISQKGGNNGPDLGLLIEVIQHPDHMDTIREFPARKELYKKYFNPNKQITMKDGSKYSSLSFALNTGDEDSLEELLTQDYKNKSPIISFFHSAQRFSSNTFDRLLAKLADNDDLKSIFRDALNSGSKKVFDALLKNDKCRHYFYTHIVVTPKVFIIDAAAGGNIDLLQQVISEYEKANKDEKKLSKVLEIGTPGVPDIIHEAMISRQSFTGGRACIEFILDKLRAEKFPLDMHFYKKYLLMAIRLNQPHTVDIIIDAIKRDLSKEYQQLFQSIRMKIDEVERTDLAILRTLKKENVFFSVVAQGIFDIKESRPVVMGTIMGIALIKFSDFINLTLESFGKRIFSQFKKFLNVKCNRPVNKAITFIPINPMLQTVLKRFNEIQPLNELKGCQISDKVISLEDDSTVMKLISYAVFCGVDVHAIDYEGKIKFWSNCEGIHAVPEDQRLTAADFLHKHEQELSEMLREHIIQTHNIENQPSANKAYGRLS